MKRNRNIRCMILKIIVIIWDRMSRLEILKVFRTSLQQASIWGLQGFPGGQQISEDKACWENETQYMFGSEILVAPVMEKGQEEREVYLPAGAEWKNVWTGECFKGGQTVTAVAPIEQIPLFTKNEFELNF